jgi:hypothetical protein
MEFVDLIIAKKPCLSKLQILTQFSLPQKQNLKVTGAINRSSKPFQVTTTYQTQNLLSTRIPVLAYGSAA